MADLHGCSATALVALIRAGEVSCREVVEAHLARIAAINPRVGAITVVLDASAREAADRADAARRRGDPLGPLHGVPFTVKESLDCVGSATTFGLPACRDARPYLDAPAVARLRAAGAIPIARTNLSELGLRLCTDNPLRGRTHNPRDGRVTIGGSSGGDAVAVVTGMAPLGLGNDLGGSLRLPAHLAGVATLKPTPGRVPHASSLPPEDLGAAGQLMLAVGPLARTVADLAACLPVLAGRDRRDPRSVDAPLRGPAPDERRAAVVIALPGAPLPAATIAALRRAGERLAAAGWIVEEAAPPEVERVGEIWHKLVATDLAASLPRARPALSAELVAYAERLIAAARLGEASNERLHQERARLIRAWSAFFEEYPVVVGPALIGPPWPHDADLDPATGLARLVDATRFVLPGSALGLPAVVLPVEPAASPTVAPEAVQIYADLWREDLCLDAAAVIEAGRPPLAPLEPR